MTTSTVQAAAILAAHGHTDPLPAASTSDARGGAPELLSDVPPPALDRAVLHGLLGDIVKAAEPTTEADPIGVLVSLLAGVGVAVGTGPFIQVGNSRHPLLIWPLIFGRTGSGRKGEATDTAERFLRADPQLAELTVTGLSSGEGLIERIRDPKDANDNGGTMDKRLLVVEPEYAGTMARAKREGSTLGAVLRQAWDGRALSVMNRQALYSSASHVGIIGHITPKEFRLRLSESDMAGGSYNRFLPVYVERSKRLPIPVGMDEALAKALGSALHNCIVAARSAGRIQLGADATALWVERIYDELTAADDEDHAWTEFTRRSAPYTLRIAALYAAIDGRSLIEADELDAAAKLVAYSVASAKYVLDRQARDPRADRIRRALDSAGATGMTRSAISALFSRNLTAAALDELLEALTASGEYEAFQQPTRGRPAQSYRRTQTAGGAA